MQNDRSYNETFELSAMRHFWAHGFVATSIRDLVAATGSNKAAIYESYGDKKGLFLACLGTYRDVVVTSAFARVEAAGAGMNEIAAFFEHQIANAERSGLPGPGCLIANSTTELASKDAEVRAFVDRHLSRLGDGFSRALLGTERANAFKRKRARTMGQFLAVSAQGLWSYSKVVATADPLRAYARLLLSITREEMAR